MDSYHVTFAIFILKLLLIAEMSGAYNAVSPQHVTGREFIKTLADVMKRPIFPLGIPAIVLRAALGEMSDIILKGSRASSDKIIDAGYRFQFSNLHDALTDLISG